MILDSFHGDGTFREKVPSYYYISNYGYSSTTVRTITHYALEEYRSYKKPTKKKASSLPEKFKPKPAWKGQK